MSPVTSNQEPVRFQTNVPVEVALKFSEGMPVHGNYGDQVMYSLVDGRRMYVQPIVEHRMKELGIAKGERVEICKSEVKRGNRKSIEWQVKRVDPKPGSELEKQLEDSIEMVNRRKAAAGGGQAAAQSKEVGEPGGSVADRSTADRSTEGTEVRTRLEHALRTAIHAAAEAEKYAKSLEYSVRFSSEDIRTMANTVLINMEGRR